MELSVIFARYIAQGNKSVLAEYFKQQKWKNTKLVFSTMHRLIFTP